MKWAAMGYLVVWLLIMAAYIFIFRGWIFPEAKKRKPTEQATKIEIKLTEHWCPVPSLYRKDAEWGLFFCPDCPKIWEPKEDKYGTLGYQEIGVDAVIWWPFTRWAIYLKDSPTRD